MRAKRATRSLCAAALVAAAVSSYAVAAWPFVTCYRVAAEHISPASAAMPGR